MKKFLTGAHLKWIAIITMFIDHFGAVVFANYAFMKGATFEGGVYNPTGPYETTYMILRLIGRLAFPMFVFMVVEGCIHSRNIKKYLSRLFIFALLSEIPFDLAISYKMVNFSYQNVFFTLFLGGLAIYFMQLIDRHLVEREIFQRQILKFIAIVLIAGLAYLLKTDYSFYGVVFIATVYILKDRPNIQLLSIFLLALYQYTAALSAPIIYFYNGERGNHPNKYIFYFFYPLHLLFLYGILMLYIVP